MIELSFVVPVYNTESQQFRQCIDSLLEQTLSNIEIVVVDDGSGPLTASECDRISEQDNRIKVIHTKNHGLSAARNTGVRSCRGKYVSFVDSDDWVEKDFGKYFVERALNSDSDVIIGRIVRNYPKKQVRVSYKMHDGDVFTDKNRSSLIRMLIDFDGNIYDAGGKIILRRLLIEDEINHDEELKQGAESLLFNYQLFLNSNRVTFVDHIGYHYRYNPESITRTPSVDNDMLVIQCFEYLDNEIKEDFADNAEIVEVLHREVLLRMRYVITSIFVSSVFNPKNKEPWRKKRQHISNIKDWHLVQETLRTNNTSDLDPIRKVTFALIKNNLYSPIKFVSIVRYFLDGIR